MISQFCNSEVWAWLTWVLCSGPYRADDGQTAFSYTGVAGKDKLLNSHIGDGINLLAASFHDDLLPKSQ